MQFIGIFNQKTKNWCTVRQNWEIDLSQKIKPNVKHVWIHCASAGEFEQAIPIINNLRLTMNDSKICVSFFSSSGFDMYKDSDLADVFFYFPSDTKTNAEKLVKILQPNLVIFIRNEIWLNILSELEEKKIPTFLVNANLQHERNFFYQLFLQKAYPLFTKIFDTKTFGNTKLQRVCENKSVEFKNEVFEDFCKDSFVIILGSSWLVEDALIALFYKKYCLKYPNLKIIIAPHEYDKKRKDEIVKLFTDWQTPNINEVISYSKYSILNTQYSILILDEKGILKYAYRYADIAFIGGGFDKGVHNITEAAVYGIPTVFGNNYHKFEEVKELIHLDVAFPVNNYTELEQKLIELINNSEKRNGIKDKLDSYFSLQENVAKNIIAEISNAIR